jgi:NTE family protein
VLGILLPGPIGNWYARALRRNLLGEATLRDVPEEPRFVFNASNLQSAVLFRFSHPYMADYRVGTIYEPKVQLATAVAASGAFPPILSPVRLKTDPAEWTRVEGNDLHEPPFTEEVFLADGGVYDNLGIETLKGFETILISDGGGHITGKPSMPADWLRQAIRVLGVIDSQVRAQRKRHAIDDFRSGRKKGTYWGIWTDIGDYPLADAIPCPLEQTTRLAQTPTRLKTMVPDLQERLINWGYAVCDAGMRSHVDPTIARPVGLPYPDRGVG